MITRLKNDIKQAMKNKDKEALSTLRMLMATIETERSKSGVSAVEDFTEDQIIVFINRNIKVLNAEIESLVTASRDASKQEREKVLLVSYLPKQLTKEEIVAEINHALDLVKRGELEGMGQAMGYLSKKLKGKADMGLVNKTIKEMNV